LARHLAPDSFAELALLNRQLAAAQVPATVVRAGVPAQAQAAAPELFTQRYGMRDFVIVLGSVEPRNNQLLLLYALRNTDLPVVIVGPVPYPEYLRKCEQAAAPTTLFLERLPAALLHSALAAARVFALPGWWQSAPSAALLAALSGCSIVLGDRGGEKEYLGADAHYCDPASVQSIGAAVLRAYARHGERAPQRAALAQRIATQYSAAVQAQQLSELYGTVLENSAIDPAATARLAIQSTAKIAELDGYHVEAEAQLLALLEADPANTAAARQLARLHLRHGRLAEGVAMLQQTLRGDPHDFDSVHRLGTALRQLGRLDEAAALLESALDFNTGRTELVLVLAEVRVDQREFLEAEKLLVQLVEDLPNDPHVLVAQGDCVLARGKADDALFCYERALHNVPNYKPAAQRLLHLHTIAGSSSGAVNLGGAVAAATAAAAAEALILRQLQDADLTTVLHQHKPDLDRNFVRLMRLVAETAQGDGRGALAAQLFKLADEMVHIHGPRVRELDDTSASADALFGAVQQAEELLTARDVAGAHAALRSALQLAPDDTWLSVANGLALMRQADFAGAQRAFAQAVLVNPRLAPAYARLASSLLALGRTHEAGQAVQRALALDRTHPQALRMLATLNATAQAAPRSARTYSDVLTKLPFDLEALLQLGDFYAQGGDWSSARAVYARAVEIDSSSAPAADRLRQAKHHTGPLPEPDSDPAAALPAPSQPAAQADITRELPAQDPTPAAALDGPEQMPPAAQPLVANAAALALRWGGSILDYSGYSWLSRQILRGLDQPQLALSLEPYAVNEQLLSELPRSLVRRWQAMLGWHTGNPVYVCFHPPVLWNGDDVYAHYRARNPHCSAAVGFTMFETDRLPQGWAAALNRMDEVWVPSQFNLETFARAGVPAEKLHVVPCGIDASAYEPANVQPLPVSGRRGFNFLSVFQWHRRKGWDVLLRAYLSAFQPEDDVCLLLRVHPDAGDAQPIAEQIDAHVRALGYDPQRIPDIVLLTDFIAEGDMPRLYAAADAFVLPTRGEGWGIPYMEAMASALPVIGTRWSSHLDFMNAANSYLIDVEQLVPVCSAQTAVNPFYTADQLWAEPSAAHTAKLMRTVFTQRAAARATGARARADICRDWTLERTAAWIIARIAILSSQPSTELKADSPARLPTQPADKPAAGVESVAIDPALSLAQAASAAPQLAAVRWHAPIFEPSGYADDARALTTRLAASGHCVLLEPVGKAVPAFEAELDAQTQTTLAELTRTQLQAPFCSVMHVPAYAFVRDPQATANIGRTMFETEGLPANWVARCNEMDEIWVPGEFNQRTFVAAGVRTPVHIVPMGVDCARFSPAAEPHPIAQLPGLKFLSVFVWQQRKGWDVLLRAWARSFRRHERVHLILQVAGSNAAAADIRAIIERFCASELGTRLDDLAPVHILTDPLYANLPGLYSAADAFVLPSRGEGWGRPYMEAMATGLPVIGTRWGGNLAFMNDFNSYLIDSSGRTEIGADIDVPYFAGLHWATPSVEHLVHSLRHIFRNRGEARQVGLLAREDMLDHWSWERAAAAAAARLQALGAHGSSLPVAGHWQQAAIPAAPATALRVRWEGSQLVHHSMALINREICARLAADDGIELSIIPDEPHVFAAGADARMQALVARINQPLSGAAHVHVRHQYPPSFTAPPAGHWVMIQPWEFGSLPQKWIEEMRAAVDEVWVPSHYLRECYIASGMPAERVAVVPNGVDVDCFHPDAAPLDLNAWTTAETQLAPGTFKFLFVGGTIWRKGPDILLAAYQQAFTHADDVCLVIKDLPFYEGFQWTERIRALQADPLAPRILYLNHNLQPAELPGLYTAADCLVYPTRGEGFGLPIAEAMACGLPVIVPAAGAQLDFCNADTAYLIPATRQDFPVQRIENLPTAGVPFLHEPDVQATAALMRAVFEDRSAAQAKAAKARTAIVAQFTWEHVAAQVQARLQSVSTRPVVRFQAAPGALPAIFVAQPQGAALAAAALSRHAAGSLQLYAVGARSALDLQPAAAPPGAVCSAAPLAQLLNQLIRHTNAPAIVLLSSDAALEPLALQQLCAALASDAELALVAPAAESKLPAATLAVRTVTSACVVFNTQVCRGLAPLREDIAFHVAFWEYLAHIQESDKKVGLAMHVNLEHDTLTTLEGAQYATLETIDAELGAVLVECQQWLAAGSYDAALPGLRAVTQTMPEFAAGHAALGAVLLKLQDPAASTAALLTATQLDPDSAIYWNQLGVAQHATGNLDGAADAFAQARNADPSDIQALLNLIDLRRAQDDIAAVSVLVKQGLQLDPTNAEVLAAFSDLCLQLDDLEGLRLGLQRLATVAPGHPALADLQAAADEREPQTAATRNLEAQLVELLELGKQCIDRGDYATAIEAFTGLTLSLPDLAAGHTALGTTLLAQGDAHAAIPALARAVQLAPDEPGLHNQLGVAMYQTGNADGAAQQFHSALQIAPQNLDAMLNLVELERARANYAAATRFADAALKTDPNHPDVLLVFGSLSLELGDSEGAGLALRRLEKSQPGHPAVGQLHAALAAHMPPQATLETLPHQNGTLSAKNGNGPANNTSPYTNGKHAGNGAPPYTNGKH
ncbi:MAG: glycosyltransferase, partial [Chloroflexi bacterium]